MRVLRRHRRRHGALVSEPVERSFPGPREVRFSLREGDVLHVTRGAANVLLETPLQRALREIADLLDKNQPVRGDEWRLQAIGFHVARAITHLGLYQQDPGRGAEDDLLHAATRLAMALQLRAEEAAG